MNISEFYEVLKGEKDVSKALKKYFTTHVAPFSARDTQNIDAVPLILYKTHACALLDGVEKSISINKLQEVISSLTNNQDETIPPISLPYGCFMFNKKGDYLYLNCYYKETVAEIKYDPRDGKKQETYKIPFPNIILSFTLKKVEKGLWQVDSVLYFCTPKAVTQLPDSTIILGTDESKGIHKLPLSNIYSNNKMCFGNNTMPVRFNDNLRGLDYYYQILAIAPFNSDLGTHGLKQSFTARNWFRHLSELETFPYELLSSSTEY